MHVGIRLYRSFFGGARSGHVGGVGVAKILGRRVSGRLREGSRPVFGVNVCRHERMEAKAVGLSKRRGSSQGTADDIAGATPDQADLSIYE